MAMQQHVPNNICITFSFFKGINLNVFSLLLLFYLDHQLARINMARMVIVHIVNLHPVVHRHHPHPVLPQQQVDLHKVVLLLLVLHPILLPVLLVNKIITDLLIR